MYNKTHILILFFILTGLNLPAQTPIPKNKPTYDDYPVHFGFSLGLNAMDFSFKRRYAPDPNNSTELKDSLFADVNRFVPGFQINIVTDFRLSDYFRIRILPGIIFGGRDLYYINRSGKTVMIQNTESNMIDIPVMLKYRAKRVNNYAPYVIGGLAGRYDLQARDNFEGKLLILFKPVDFYYEFGVGIDYYLPYFKLSTELKMSVGMLDVLNHRTKGGAESTYVSSIDRLNSNIMFLTFYFE